MPRRKRVPRPDHKTPTPPDLVLDPELAVLSVLAHVLDIATAALLAEHPTLIDDFRRPRDDGPIVTLASTLCRRAADLADTLAAYDRAVRDTAPSPNHDEADPDLPF
jgi:hypothetical protein